MEHDKQPVAWTATTAAPSRVRADLRVADLAAGILAFSLVALLATNGGGYWPTAWSWTAFLLAWLSIVVILLAPPASLARREKALVAASFALLGWNVLSAVWSESVPRTVGEVQRVAAYVAIVVACTVVVRSRSYASLLVGTWAGLVVVSSYSLATRLLPERFGQFDPIAGYRLSAPVGYWNALGILAALGIILAIGLAARGRLVTSVTAAVSLVILVPTLYFTFSRGAWLALAVGTGVALVLDAGRLQLAITVLALAVFPAIAVAWAYGSDALTQPVTSLEAATRDGHRLTGVLLALAIAQGVVMLALRRLEPRIRVPADARRAVGLLAATVLALVLVVALVRLGGPQDVVQRAHRAFLVRTPPENLNQRLLSLSSNGRIDLWSVAWQRFEQSPWLGAGPGTYEISWMRDRSYNLKVRDAHSLYAESMSELGAVGTALLVLVLALPLSVSLRERRRRLVPIAAGAYAAFLVHAGVDWDWEMPAVVGTGLVCGIALLAASRTAGGRPLPWITATVLLAAMLVIAVFSFAGVVGQGALATAERAASEDAHARAEREALRAKRWQPWSSAALRVAGEAQLALGQRAEARSTLSRAVAKDPLDWNLWLDLAFASDGRARTRAARRAEQLNPLAPQIAAARAELGLEGEG